LLWRSGSLMQAVNILRDDGLNAPQRLQARDRSMGGIRLRVPEVRPCLQLVVPIFDALGLASQKVLEVNGLLFGPHAVGPAKIGDAAAGGNPRTGEHQNAMGGSQTGDEVRVVHGCLPAGRFCHGFTAVAALRAAAESCPTVRSRTVTGRTS